MTSPAQRILEDLSAKAQAERNVTRIAPKPAQDEPEWFDLDPATLPAEIAKAYAEYKALYAAATEARKSFEAAFSALSPPPAGHRIAFAYKFGKLRMAVVSGAAKASGAGKSALSFADARARIGGR